MKPHFAKIVTEKPRRGHHANRSEKFGGRLTQNEVAREQDDDSLPGGFLPWSRRRNADYKEFSDLLGPLRGYLRKQVGRPWDKVYSELSARLDKRSLTGIHIWDHIKSEVEMHAFLGDDGKTVYRQPRYGIGLVPVYGLYVHPRTRLLCHKPDRRFVGYKRRPAPNRRELNDGRVFEKIAGIWYEVWEERRTERLPAQWLTWNYRGRETHHHLYREAHEETTIVVIYKRQLGRKELRLHGLTNVSPSRSR